MEFHDVVRKRHMVRNYRPDPVDRDVVERIVATARRAPSAGFTQGVYFVVVTDQDTRRAIAHAAEEPRWVARGYPPWMSRAPVHVVVCVGEADYHARYREPDKLRDDGTEMQWPIPYWWIDAGAALMLLLLTAVDEGLSAGFFGTHRAWGVSELLGIPDEVTPIGIVTIGHGEPGSRGSAARGRRPLHEVVRWERW